MSYTADDLIAWLPIVAGPQWQTLQSGRIRDDMGRCPLCALADEIAGTPTGHYELASYALQAAGVPESAAFGRGDVMDAADVPNDPLRPALMAALGMTP